MRLLRVGLVDDHTLVRSGLRSLLEKSGRIEIAGEASDGREAVELAKQKTPDIILLDIAMANLNGLEACSRIIAASPSTRVIILSMHSNEEYVLQALRAGASGYLLKNAADTELTLALDSVTRGETYLSPAIPRKVLEQLRKPGTPSNSQEQLTARQREILQLVAEGKSTKEIAYQLQLSTKTVEAHRAQLMERLSIFDVAGLVRYAMKIGLIQPE